MAALTTQQEYDAVREALQQLTTLDTDGNRRDVVQFMIDGQMYSYAANQMKYLQEREIILAKRLCTRNRRKRTTPDFSY